MSDLTKAEAERIADAVCEEYWMTTSVRRGLLFAPLPMLERH